MGNYSNSRSVNYITSATFVTYFLACIACVALDRDAALSSNQLYNSAGHSVDGVGGGRRCCHVTVGGRVDVVCGGGGGGGPVCRPVCRAVSAEVVAAVGSSLAVRCPAHVVDR